MEVSKNEKDFSPDSSTIEGRRARKRTFSEDFGGDINESGQSTNSATAIPNETSYWNVGVLDLLGIVFEKQNLHRPITIVKKMLENLPILASKRIASVETIVKRARAIMECLNEFKPLQRLDFDNILQIRDKEDSNYPLITPRKDGCSEWTVKIPSNPIKLEEHWYHMFINYTDVFAEDLKYMISTYQHDKKIPESMYSVLFKDFIGMFGLLAVATPTVPKQSMKIGCTEVSSIPDMLLMDQLNVVTDTPGAFSMDILTLIKSKTEFEFRKPEEPSPSLLRSKSTVHVSDTLLGEHVGELLVHCPHSSCKNHGIMGMIVEETYVTFTYLTCSEEQLELIKSGKCYHPDHRPTVIFSKRYNFLKNSDREELIEPLLLLGLLQRI